MKRVSILLMSFLIFSISSAHAEEESTTTVELSTSTEIVTSSTASTTEEFASSTENLISKDFYIVFSEKVDDIKKQFGAYISRIDLINQKISSKIEVFSKEGFDTEEVSQIVAESNSALEKAKILLEETNSENTSGTSTTESTLQLLSKTKNELGSAKNEIRKAQEKGKIAISKLKLLTLEQD